MEHLSSYEAEKERRLYLYGLKDGFHIAKRLLLYEEDIKIEYKECILKVKMAVEEELGKDYEVKLQRVLKNNGSLLDGLSICKGKENCAPVIYLNAYYEQFKREMPFNETLRILWRFSLKTRT